MGYYNYKRMYSAVPLAYREAYETKWKEENGRDFEGTADYDGDLRSVTHETHRKRRTPHPCGQSASEG